MNRLKKKPWWLALAVAGGVIFLPVAAQALPMSYQYYRGNFGADATQTYKGILADSGTDLSRWAPGKVDGNTLRVVDFKGTTVRPLSYGDAGVFNMGEGHPTMEGSAFVKPRGRHLEVTYVGPHKDADGSETKGAGAAPEPETFVLVGLGLLGIAGLAKAQG